MSIGNDILTAGWQSLLDVHAEDAEFHAVCGDENPVPVQVLVSKPSESAQFGRRKLGVSYELHASQSAAPWAVDSCIVLGGVNYRILEIERDPSGISVRLSVGLSKLAGRRTA